MDAVKVAIVIASYGRPDFLNDTLASLSKSLTGAGARHNVDVIVVASPEDTPTHDVCQHQKFPEDIRFRLVTEAQRGLSPARNKGVKEAGDAEIVAFLDDDVELVEGWLDRMMVPFADPKVLAVGGRVLPYGETPPSWLKPRFYGMLSLFDEGLVSKPVHKGIGCNFAVRAECFSRYGLFNTTLGRRGKLLMGFEETEFFRRLPKYDGRVWYAPEALVYHKVGDRMTLEYLRKIAYASGYSFALMVKVEGKLSEHLWQSIKSVGKLILAGQLVFGPLLPDRQRVTWIIRWHYARGYLASWVQPQPTQAMSKAD